jgi:hypothetical protein
MNSERVTSRATVKKQNGDTTQQEETRSMNDDNENDVDPKHQKISNKKEFSQEEKTKT